MSEALRQVVWKCDRCGGDAQAIFGIFPSCKCGSTSFKAAQPPAPTAQQCQCKDRPADQCPGEWEPGCDLGANPAHVQVAQPVQQPGAEPLQGGMDNAELLAAWKKKLPGVEPSDAQLPAFAVGVEVGFAHARDLERQDWSRVHHALAKHGVHPGRTDDHLADVIDRALAAPAQRQPLTAEAVFASKDFMSMNGLYWGLGIETLMQIVRVTERECAAAWGVTLAQKGEKL